MQFSVKVCSRVGNNTFKSNICYWCLYHKKVLKQTFIYLVGCLLLHIQDLNNYPSGTRIWFAYLILEGQTKLMDGSSARIAGDVVPFWGYYSQFSVLPPSQDSVQRSDPYLIPYLFFGPAGKNSFLENIQLLNKQRSLLPLLSAHIFMVKA